MYLDMIGFVARTAKDASRKLPVRQHIPVERDLLRSNNLVSLVSSKRLELISDKARLGRTVEQGKLPNPNANAQKKATDCSDACSG